MNTNEKLSGLEKDILNIVQKDFPVCVRPFEDIARKIGGVSESEVVDSLRRLNENGYLRRLGPIFDAGRLGYASTLAAVGVSNEKVELASAVINSYPEVTHNYLRDDTEFNVWFTVTASSQQRLLSILEEIREKLGVSEVINLPVKKMFKIKVEFSV